MDIPETNKVKDGPATEILQIEAANGQFEGHDLPTVGTVPHHCNRSFAGTKVWENLEVDDF